MFVPFADECRDLLGRMMKEQLPEADNLANRCLTGTKRVEDLVRMVRDLEVRRGRMVAKAPPATLSAPDLNL